jgi:ribulose-phosphate 3-epimerase
VQKIIVPAIIAKSQTELDGMINRLKGIVKRVQLDIMDGKFVPNTSLDFDFNIPNGFEYEAHLMIEKPLIWLEKNVNRIDNAIIHIETITNVADAIKFARKKGKKVSFALRPETPISVLPPLKDIDGVLILTVKPGSYCINKEFLPEPLEKIRSLRDMDHNIPIEVDGCINPKNARLAKEYGANIFAAGSYIFKNKSIVQAINDLKEAIL